MTLPKCLLEHLPMKCICGTELEVDTPFMDNGQYGLKSKPCTKCGAPGAYLSTYRDKEEMARDAKEIFSSALNLQPPGGRRD